MDHTFIAAALGAVIGLVLALTGAGGGILAIPLLVFGLHLSVLQAAPVGLAAVGIASAVGAVLGLRQGIVRYRAAGVIGVCGMVMAPLGVALAHRLPDQPMLALFAGVMAYAAWRMLRQSGAPEDAAQSDLPCHVNAAQGRLVWTSRCARTMVGIGALSGLLSGLLGVGGGFVIVPALSRTTGLEIRSVQATSLAVIALVSISGLAAAIWQGALVWSLAAPFVLGATAALLLGRQLASKVPAAHLRQAFAWLSLAVAALMIARAMHLL